MAPAANILVVIPRIQTQPSDPFSLGYFSSHVEVSDYIKEVARTHALPVVVNLSLGMNAGAHDGTSALEAAFDAFSGGGREPGFIVVKSAGNEHGILHQISRVMRTSLNFGSKPAMKRNCSQRGS